MSFFISTEPFDREVESPDGQKGTVKLRRLNAGDQAAIQDTLRMSMNEDADASLALGTMRMLTVQRSLISWSWGPPGPTPDTIAQLEPEVFEQIYSFCEIGSPPTQANDDGKVLPSEEKELVVATAPKTRSKAASAS